MRTSGFGSIADTVMSEAEVVEPLEIFGSVLRIESTLLKVFFPGCQLHALLAVERTHSDKPLYGRVVAIDGNICTISPLGSTQGVRTRAEVWRAEEFAVTAFGPHLIGAAMGSAGNEVYRFCEKSSISKKLERLPPRLRTVTSCAPPALTRKPIEEIFETGIRAIDGFTTVGRGQRLGIFAEPGVGKSSLLGSLLHASDADAVVVALIGERGREVREFLDHNLSEEAKSRTSLVFSTSEEPPLARIEAALFALSLAEYLREQGLNVLFLVDSLTRLCRAYREIGLIAGEAPVRRGYPHSVFARLPEFIERAGSSDRGAITAFYTVLMSSDLEEDPMVEEIKSLTDGHIVLRRQIAESGRYPAMDVPRSISRLERQLVDPETIKASTHLRALLARLDQDKDLILFGGKADEELSEALALEPKIHAFLKQSPREICKYEETRRGMMELVS